jgi:ACT domain-containing protein
MARTPHTDREIFDKLRSVDLMISEGKSVLEAIGIIGISRATYYRWRSKDSRAIKECKMVSSLPWQM